MLQTDATPRLDVREPVLREDKQYGLEETLGLSASVILSRRRRIWPANKPRMGES